MLAEKLRSACALWKAAILISREVTATVTATTTRSASTVISKKDTTSTRTRLRLMATLPISRSLRASTSMPGGSLSMRKIWKRCETASGITVRPIMVLLAIRTSSRPTSLRFRIVDVPDGYAVEHADGDPWNCRKNNLKLLPLKEHVRSRRAPSTNTSGVKGVSFNKRNDVWEAYLSGNRRQSIEKK